MVTTIKLITKLEKQTIKKAELDTLLTHLEFKKYRGKGSHEVWGHKDYSDVHIVIATHTKEVPRYQQKQIFKILNKRGLL
ncbi:MAG: type II toxin-antitoxin system HicA family toxin [bacterium]|nr:type II toxin-antitoxin system HicA family toxin [bacterium]MBU1918751.1 type II toxin-antitoxin system HicA family toxin [bacterium]